MITVLVAARDAATRARLEGVVAASRALRLVAGPPDLPLGRRVATWQPDVVLLDLDGERLAPSQTGLRGGIHAPLVVLADAPRRVLGDTAATRGLVRAVLPRDATAGEIVAAIEAVAAGLVALHPDALLPAAGHGLEPERAEPVPGQALTAREIEVLGMLAEGLGNKIIAARLGISAHTAKYHVASIMAKLGAGSRTEAVAIGMRRGLVAI